jgi:hypothetical protein
VDGWNYHFQVTADSVSNQLQARVGLTMPPGLRVFPRLPPFTAVYGQNAICSFFRGNSHSTVSLNVIPCCFDATSSLSCRTPQRRMNSSSSPRPEEEQPKGPNEDQLPHVSKEEAQIGRIVGGKCDGNASGSPELEQGTPVDEVSPFDVQ